MSRLRVARAEEIEAGTARLVQAPTGPVAVFRIGDDYLAVDELCPHRAGPLSEGSTDGFIVTCPWHNARFDLRTGAVIDGPTKKPLTCRRVVVDQGTVYLESDDPAP